jgi:AraC-like DNA-binding protein
MAKAEGFPGQRLRVLARPLVAESLTRPGTSRLVVTDCGMFPRAAQHARTRPQGVDQAIVLACTEGDGWYRTGGERHTVEAGQVVVIPPGVPHAYGAGKVHPWTIWWLHLAGDDVKDLLRAAGLDTPHPPVWVDDLYRLTTLIDEALTHLGHDDSPGATMGASGAAWHLLALLTPDQRPSRDRMDPVRQVIGLLQSQVATRTTVAELAATANLSPSHFAALFRRATGLGVLQYQTSLRMTKARVLLDTTDEPVSAVARAVGYPDPFYFSRQFHALHGMSPSAYRAAAKG